MNKKSTVVKTGITKSLPCLSYGLENGENILRFPGGERDFSYLQSVQIGPVDHQVSYSMGTVGCYRGTTLPERERPYTSTKCQP
jgi:hypothetical protein